MKKPEGWNEIKELVSARIGVPQESFFLKSRKKDVVLARRIFYILCSRTICRTKNQEQFISLMGDEWDDRSILSYYEKCHTNDMQVHKEYRQQFKSMQRETKEIYTKAFQREA
jgi:hypothetical protein